jgi:hypothetical protein
VTITATAFEIIGNQAPVQKAVYWQIGNGTKDTTAS